MLLRRAIMSSLRFISIGQGEAPPFEEWQEVECPARLDLAGENVTLLVPIHHMVRSGAVVHAVNL